MRSGVAYWQDFDDRNYRRIACIYRLIAIAASSEDFRGAAIPPADLLHLKRFFASPPVFVEVAHWDAIQAVCRTPEVAVHMTDFLAMAIGLLAAGGMNEALIYAIRFIRKMVAVAPRVVAEFNSTVGIFSWFLPLMLEARTCTALFREIHDLLVAGLGVQEIGQGLILVLAPLCIFHADEQNKNRALRAAAFDFLDVMIGAIRKAPQVYGSVLESVPELEEFFKKDYPEYRKQWGIPYGGEKRISPDAGGQPAS
jgi:hypothetical protein